MNAKLTTKQLTITALMLAISVASMFFKNINPLISGPIVNLCLIFTTLTAGIYAGLLLSIITPIASFAITGSPIIAAVPTIMPCIAAGNFILVLAVGIGVPMIEKLLEGKKIKRAVKDIITLIPSLLAGSVLKFIFMAVLIVKIILPTLGAALPAPAVNTATYMFSTLQLVTALIASGFCCVIWPLIKPAILKANSD